MLFNHSGTCRIKHWWKFIHLSDNLRLVILFNKAFIIIMTWLHEWRLTRLRVVYNVFPFSWSVNVFNSKMFHKSIFLKQRLTRHCLREQDDCFSDWWYIIVTLKQKAVSFVTESFLTFQIIIFEHEFYCLIS